MIQVKVTKELPDGSVSSEVVEFDNQKDCLAGLKEIYLEKMNTLSQRNLNKNFTKGLIIKTKKYGGGDRTKRSAYHQLQRDYESNPLYKLKIEILN